jgi:hypothetical protein
MVSIPGCSSPVKGPMKIWRRDRRRHELVACDSDSAKQRRRRPVPLAQRCDGDGGLGARDGDERRRPPRTPRLSGPRPARVRRRYGAPEVRSRDYVTRCLLQGRAAMWEACGCSVLDGAEAGGGVDVGDVGLWGGGSRRAVVWARHIFSRGKRAGRGN